MAIFDGSSPALKALIEREIQRAERVLPPPPDGCVVARGDSIMPEAIRWVWPGWLAAGKVHLLAGAPGCGKTTITLAIAAAITNGKTWPDGTRCDSLGDVLIWSGEDDLADTLIPRLIAEGADTRRTHFVRGVCKDGEMRPFDPSTDVHLLIDVAKKIPGLRMVIIDPVSVAVAGDSYKNAEVRRGLQPLVDFAASAGVALLGISHLTKGGATSDPASRVLGSVAFVAVARIVWLAAKVHGADDGERRVLVRAKSNIGPDGGGFGYDLEQIESAPGIYASHILWGEQLIGSARVLLSDDDEGSTQRGQQAQVEAFLRERLAQGTSPSSTLRKEGEAAGYKWKILCAAADRIGVRKTKGGYQGAWYWSLPGAVADAQDDSAEA